jgi:hypothetical protein
LVVPSVEKTVPAARGKRILSRSLQPCGPSIFSKPERRRCSRERPSRWNR